MNLPETVNLPETITIPTSEYLSLLESEHTLEALQAAGVDNWEGYGEVDWAHVQALSEAAKERLQSGPHVATIVDADRIAEEAHRGQVDKAGQPYIDHPRAVADLLSGCGPNAVMAALLHDVVEDSDTTLDGLRAAGFPEEVVRAVDSVTRRDGEPYMAMIARAAADRLGCLVKLADNDHNTSRLSNLDEPDRSRLSRKYVRARVVLLAAADVHAVARAREVLATLKAT